MRSPFLHRYVVALGIVAALAVTGRAADPVPSLASIPADAAFYSSSLRLGEQWDRFTKSKAFAALHDLPAVKHLVQHIHDEINKGDGPAGQIAKALHDPANRELMELCHDAFHDEVFLYGGANWARFMKVLMEVNKANQFGPALAALQGGNPQYAQAKALIHALNAAGDNLQVPEMVFGFRITKTDAATNQIKRLEDVLLKATEKTPLKGRVKRAKVAGADALTLTVDGSMIPWDKIPLEFDDDTNEEAKTLFGKLKTLNVSLCLLVKGNVLLVSMGPTTSTADSFGSGTSLATRMEMKPLAKYADKPLIGVSYISAAVAASVATTSQDIEGIVEMVKSALAKAPLSEERRKAIEKDARQLAKEMAATLTKPAGTFSCTFLTERGQETYSYDFSPAPAGGTKLSIVEHLGGSPLLAIAVNTGDPTPGYKTLVRWLRIVYGHADAIVKEMLGDDVHTQFQGGMDMVRPFLTRLDTIMGSQLFPAVGAGEFAFVIDGKWESKKWYAEFDQGGNSLPFIEIGVVRSVNDSAQVLKSLQALRALANDVMAKARDFGAPIPESGLPEAQSKSLNTGTAFYWPIPPIGIDLQVQPNLGIAGNTIVKSLSLAHTERLLTSTPLKTQGGVLETDRPLYAAAVIDIAGLIGVGRPWLEKLAMPVMLADLPDNAPPGVTKKEIPDQVRTFLDVLQCLRGVRSVTYRDGDATVTHSEFVVRDLK